MNYPVARLYASEEKARDVISRLVAEDIPESAICLVAPPGTAEDAPPADLRSAIRAGRLLGEDAEKFAARVQAGRSLLVVDAPFGMGGIATEIMAKGGPVDTEVRRAAELPRPSSGTMFSEFIGAPPLTRKPGILLDFDEPLLDRENFTFSSFFGLGMLSRKATPLSSLFGMKTLTAPKSNWDRSLGLPLLATPKPGRTSSFGFPLLTKSSGKEWKSSFGFPLLSSKPTPFSSMFGLQVLSNRR